MDSFQVRKRGTKRKRVRVIPQVINSIEWYYNTGQQYDSPQHRALFYACYLSGARISEILNLTPDSFGIGTASGKKYIYIHIPTLKSRVRTERKVPILTLNGERDMGKYLLAYMRDLDSSAHLFTLSRTAASHALRRLVVTLRVQDPKTRDFINEYPFRVHPHWLRKSRATHWHNFYGMDAYSIMELGGWASLASTQPYIVTDTSMLVSSIMAKAGVRG